MPSEEQLQRMDDFLQEEVRQWTEYLLSRMKVAAGKTVVSEEYLRSLATSAAEEGLQKAKAELSFSEHGRFADMGAGRMYTKGVYHGDRDARGRQHLIGRKGNKNYSRTAYGTLNGLMEGVANKYLERTPELIKQALTDGTAN